MAAGFGAVRRGGADPRSVSPINPAAVVPGGMTKIAEAVWVMYSFNASLAARRVCMVMNCRRGSRWYATKARPASKVPSLARPSWNE